jgi:hypothetical protein
MLTAAVVVGIDGQPWLAALLTGPASSRWRRSSSSAGRMLPTCSSSKPSVTP